MEFVKLKGENWKAQKNGSKRITLEPIHHHNNLQKLPKDLKLQNFSIKKSLYVARAEFRIQHTDI